MDKPSLLTKILFWIILGMWSTFLAEVVAGSNLFPFFVPHGVLFILPVYLFHTIVLGTVVYRWGKPTFPVLYLAGTIFGLYEAYMTKVLWFSYTPDGPPLLLGGVGVIEFIVLVLFLHSIFAFIIPLLLAESFLVSSRDGISLLPERIRKSFIRRGVLWTIIFGIFTGLFSSLNSPNPAISLLSGMGNGLLLVGVTFYARRKTRAYSMKDLLPSLSQWIVLTVILVALYFIYSPWLEPGLPDARAQATIVAAYAVLGTLLVLHLVRSRFRSISPISKPPLTWKSLIIFFVVFALSSGISTFFLAPVKIAVLILIWLTAVVAGGSALLYCVKKLLW